MAPNRRLLVLALSTVAAVAAAGAAAGAAAPAPHGSASPHATPPKHKGIWEPINYPADVELRDVTFVTPDEGWIAGGTSQTQGGFILHTTDGGTHWNVQYGDPADTAESVGELRFLDAKQGWAVQLTGSESRLLHTRDGGAHWTLAGTVEEHNTGYMFTSEKDGVQLAPHVIKRTTDGGRSWKPVFPCAAKVQVNGLTRNAECEWRSLSFPNPTTAFAVGMSYASKTTLFLAKSTDGGASWTMTTAELTDAPDKSFFVDGKTGFVRVGYPGDGQLFETRDGGATWDGLAPAPGDDIRFADPTTGMSAIFRTVSFTTDGGSRWTSRKFAFPADVSAVSLPRANRGYVVGEHGMIYRYRVVPHAYTAPGIIPAPRLSDIDSPLPD